MLHMQSKAVSNEATLEWLIALQIVSCCLYLLLSHSDVCVPVCDCRDADCTILEQVRAHMGHSSPQILLACTKLACTHIRIWPAQTCSCHSGLLSMGVVRP